MRSIRLGALAGTGFFVLTMVGNGMNTSGENPGTGGAAALANLQRHQTLGNQVGIGLEVSGFLLLFFFLGALHRILRRAEDPDGWLATSGFAAGISFLAVKLMSGAFVLAARERKDVLTPALARTLNDIGGTAFVVSGALLGMATLAAGLSCLGSGALPRWLGWSGAVCGAGAVAETLVGVYHPLSYFPGAFLLSMLWVAVVGVVLFRQPAPRAMPDLTASPDATAVRASA
ncbi:MAG: hypothetical protein QOJ60_2930 [Actinomycetota bacterium]|jgi:hypothetical protein|nr:hypothetical protein [Actinomycetota bacterium]